MSAEPPGPPAPPPSGSPRPTAPPPSGSPPPPPPPPPAAARARGLQLLRVRGVPVYVNASWLLLAAILIVWYAPVAQRLLPGLSQLGGYLLAVTFAGSLLLSVLLHELGHALVARHYGIGVRAITLELLGGYTEMEGDSPHPRADLFVSGIGPVVSAVIGGVALGVEFALPDGSVIDALAFQLAWSNIIVAAFNALPGLPLDGGRVLRALIWRVTGNRHTGTTAAGWIGRVVAIATLAASALLLQTGVVTVFNLIFAALIALTLWQGASAAIAYGRLQQRLPQLDVRRLTRPVFTVQVGTPLAEAIRRAAEASPAVPPALGITDGEGRVVALVSEQAAQAVPIERRPWVPVDSVARTLEPGRTLAADLAGPDVIRAVQAHPAPNYLVVSGEKVVGVLETADLARALGR